MVPPREQGGRRAATRFRRWVSKVPGFCNRLDSHQAIEVDLQSLIGFSQHSAPSYIQTERSAHCAIFEALPSVPDGRTISFFP